MLTWVNTFFHLTKVPEINVWLLSFGFILEVLFPEVVFDVDAKAYSIFAVRIVIGLFQEGGELEFSVKRQWLYIERKIGVDIVPDILKIIIIIPAFFFNEFGNICSVLSEKYELPNVLSDFLGNSVLLSGFRTFIDDCHFPLGLLVKCGIAVFHLPRRVKTLGKLFFN